MRALISSFLIAASCFADDLCYGNPSAFRGKPSIRTFLYGDFFFASVREDGLTFAMRSNDGNPLHGKYLEPCDRWRPGFRIGFGSHLAHDNWELAGDWTCFKSDLVQTAHANFAPSGGTYLVPLLIDASSYAQFLGGKSIQEAKEHWVLNYNALTFTLSRPYYLSRELGIRPLIGIFTAFIDQDIEVTYRSNAAPPGGGNNVVAYQTMMENDAWRVGPLIGSKLDWLIRRKFRFFGTVETALLYRRMNFSQTQMAVGNSGGDFRLLLTEETHRMQPWIDAQLGLGWNSCINRSRNFFEISLQYEVQYFWQELESRILYQQITGVQDRNLNQYGDLSLQSVALRFRLDF